MALTTAEMAARLLLAVALGAVVGLEREGASRAAGMRTHAVVSLGAALFTLAGAYGFGDLDRGGESDPARVAAQVATGVGFIGAGAIIRNGASVMGVTTAATVWLAASVGVMSAAGGYGMAVAATALSLIALVALAAIQPLTRGLGRRQTILEIEYDRGHGTLGPVLQRLAEAGAVVHDLSIEDEPIDADADGVRRVTLVLRSARSNNLDRLVERFENRPEVRRVRIGVGETA